MYHDISYKGRPTREAILDWAQWLGFRRSVLLARIAAGRDPEVGTDLQARWRNFNIGCGFAGVSGHPVREAFKLFAKINQAELEAIPD